MRYAEFYAKDRLICLLKWQQFGHATFFLPSKSDRKVEGEGKERKRGKFSASSLAERKVYCLHCLLPLLLLFLFLFLLLLLEKELLERASEME